MKTKTVILFVVIALHFISLSNFIFAKVNDSSDKRGKIITIKEETEDDEEDCGYEEYDHYELDTKGNLEPKGKVLINTCDDQDEKIPWIRDIIEK